MNALEKNVKKKCIKSMLVGQWIEILSLGNWVEQLLRRFERHRRICPSGYKKDILADKKLWSYLGEMRKRRRNIWRSEVN